MGGVQYHGGYHDAYGGSLEYRGGCSVVWGIHDKCGDILSTVRGVQYRGGYHEYHGGYLEYRGRYSVPWGYHDVRGDIMSTVGEIFCYLNNPTAEHPHGTHDISHMHHDIPHSTQITKDGIPLRN